VSAAPNEFSIDEVRFRVDRLKPKVSLAGLRLVGKVLLPAIAEARGAPDGQIGNAVSKVVEGLDCLPELLDLFVPRTQVPNPLNEATWISLAPVVDDVFTGRPDLLVQFLAKAVQHEYANFFSAGSPFAGMLAKVQQQAKAPSA
jgi:hypothetical protein